jgi:hypothetical protein
MVQVYSGDEGELHVLTFPTLRRRGDGAAMGEEQTLLWKKETTVGRRLYGVAMLEGEGR